MLAELVADQALISRPTIDDRLGHRQARAHAAHHQADGVGQDREELLAAPLDQASRCRAAADTSRQSTADAPGEDAPARAAGSPRRPRPNATTAATGRTCRGDSRCRCARAGGASGRDWAGCGWSKRIEPRRFGLSSQRRYIALYCVPAPLFTRGERRVWRAARAVPARREGAPAGDDSQAARGRR